VPPDYDFDWVTIDKPGNAPYDGPDPSGWGMVLGRGGVDYSYRISRLEVTTGQWMEFVNTYSTKSNEWKFFADPAYWGATPDPAYGGPGRKWKLRADVPNAAMLPVAGISWRESAMFCNWLHNDKDASLAAIEDGAYDASTFGKNPDGTFTDQLAHHPDAKFWIPTLDEWLKAAHYDPDRYGPGQEGWWIYPHASDQPPVSGPPREGESSAGYVHPEFSSKEWDIPLGAYPDTLSPWGLLDTSGATGEHIEEAFQQEWRLRDGAAAGPSGLPMLDEVWYFGTSHPYTGFSHAGLRVVSAVPSPAAGVFIIAILVRCSRRARPAARRGACS
jgi:hypothetical protein